VSAALAWTPARPRSPQFGVKVILSRHPGPTPRRRGARTTTGASDSSHRMTPTSTRSGLHNKGRTDMASSGKKRTTMGELTRESKLRERRLDKQAKKDARKQAPASSSPTRRHAAHNDRGASPVGCRTACSRNCRSGARGRLIQAHVLDKRGQEDPRALRVSARKRS
jgi:hypothetical protein